MASAPEARVLKMQSAWPAAGTLQDNFKFLAERVDKLTGGALKIETMAGGQVVPPFEVLDAGSLVVDGLLNVSDFNDLTPYHIPESDDYETVAGFVTKLAGRIPEAEEEYAHDTLRIRVLSVHDRRIERIRFRGAELDAAPAKPAGIEPGDVIATGTPDGVGFARTPPEFLKDGDVMEVEIAKIGILRNAVKIAALAKV